MASLHFHLDWIAKESFSWDDHISKPTYSSSWTRVCNTKNA